jgi:hypothetical protein
MPVFRVFFEMKLDELQMVDDHPWIKRGISPPMKQTA